MDKRSWPDVLLDLALWIVVAASVLGAVLVVSSMSRAAFYGTCWIC